MWVENETTNWCVVYGCVSERNDVDEQVSYSEIVGFL